jgi:ribosomal protein S12 methylthiotransferase
MIDIMGSRKQILPYLDIPLQHANPRILKLMRRPSNMNSVRTTIQKLRSSMPEIAIRTTFIVGFPGETEEDFQDLLDFVEETKFDHVGAFTYFQEVGTTAEKLGDPISEAEKEDRLSRLMSLQQEISLKKNQAFIGKKLPILIEGYNEGISIGRSYRDAPEIDGLVFVEGELPIGNLCEVKITDALAHDLVGLPI